MEQTFAVIVILCGWIVLSLAANTVFPYLCLLTKHPKKDQVVNDMRSLYTQYWELRTPAYLFAFGWSGKYVAGASGVVLGFGGPMSLPYLILYGSLFSLFLAVAIISVFGRREFPIHRIEIDRLRLELREVQKPDPAPTDTHAETEAWIKAERLLCKSVTGL